MSNHIYSHHYTYEITNKKSGIRYIGVRSCNCNPNNDSYMGSCKILNETISVEGKENFTKKILQTFPTREEAAQHEIELHEKFDVARNPMFYNNAKATSTGFNIAGKKRTEEDKHKISKTLKGRKLSEEHKRKLSEAKKGKKGHVSWIKGKKLSEEYKRKISEAHKGKKMSDAAKRKMSESKKGNTNCLGRKLTEETKRKISEANYRRWAKKKVSGRN